MVENLTVYPIIGFVITYLALEVAWHLAVCKHKSQTMAPCVFKQVKMLIA